MSQYFNKVSGIVGTEPDKQITLEFYVEVHPPVGNPQCQCSHCSRVLEEHEAPLMLCNERVIAIICEVCADYVMPILLKNKL